MDAKNLLDHIARFPPQPLHGGCLKIALRPFLRTLQISGVYHEHQHYIKTNNSRQVQSHYTNVVDGPNDDFYTDAKRVPDVFTSEQAATVSQSKLFTRRERDHVINTNNVMTINKNDTDFRRRDNATSNMATSVSGSLISTDDLYLTGNSRENIYQSISGVPIANTDNFLVRCGIVEKSLTRSAIVSLGYDVPVMVNEADAADVDERSVSLRDTCLRYLWSDRTYSFVFLLLHWANFLRCAMYIQSTVDVAIMTALIPILWYLMVACFSTAMFISCYRRDHFLEFFIKWGAIFKDPVTRSLGLRGVTSSKFVNITVVIHWAIVFINMVCLVFLMLKDDSFSGGMNCIFYLTGYRSTTVIAVTSVILFFTSNAWIGTIIGIVVLCHLVETHFRELHYVLQLHIAAAGMNFPQSLNLLRERHLAMCETVIVLDRYFKIIVGTAYSIFLTLGCLLLYQLVKVEMDESVMVITMFWLVSTLSMIAISTYFMANVNVAMHAISDDLFTIQSRHVTMEQFCQLQMFIAKANGPSLGFTVMGLVVITRELMLTLFGIYLTYAIVLLQFP